MATQVSKGTHFILFTENPELPGDWLPIAGTTTHGINKTIETKETTSKDDGDQTSKEGSKVAWDMSVSGLLLWSKFFDLNAIADAMQPVKLLFGEVDANTRQLKAGKCVSGSALMTKLSATFPDKDNATFDVTFEGTGRLEEFDYVVAP